MMVTRHFMLLAFDEETVCCRARTGNHLLSASAGSDRRRLGAVPAGRALSLCWRVQSGGGVKA